MTTPLPPPAIDQPDPIFAPSAVFPLGRSVDRVEISDAAPTTERPFGLHYAVVPAATDAVNLAALRYDNDQQISVTTTGAPAYDKHSTGQTSTQTSDGHQGMDSDTDYTED